jgi:hypothetical protein
MLWLRRSIRAVDSFVKYVDANATGISLLGGIAAVTFLATAYLFFPSLFDWVQTLRNAIAHSDKTTASTEVPIAPAPSTGPQSPDKEQKSASGSAQASSADIVPSLPVPPVQLAPEPVPPPKVDKYGPITATAFGVGLGEEELRRALPADAKWRDTPDGFEVDYQQNLVFGVTNPYQATFDVAQVLNNDHTVTMTVLRLDKSYNAHRSCGTVQQQNELDFVQVALQKRWGKPIDAPIKRDGEVPKHYQVINYPVETSYAYGDEKYGMLFSVFSQELLATNGSSASACQIRIIYESRANLNSDIAKMKQ